MTCRGQTQVLREATKTYNFMKSDREQDYLLPPNVREWLTPGDLAWFLLDAVAQPLENGQSIYPSHGYLRKPIL